MASTVFAARNQATNSFMGEIPNYSNTNPRHLNPNPNPNQKPKSNKKKQYTNSIINSRSLINDVHHSPTRPTKAGSDDAYSYNQRPAETGSAGYGFNQGVYVTYHVSSCTRKEINELRKKLVADLERVRKLNDRIQTGEVNPRSGNGKFKKLTGNKRMPGTVSGSVSGLNGSKNKVMKVFCEGEIHASVMKMCKQVLTKLMKQKLSWPFNKPVDAAALGLHDYHQIVKRPMDLGTVKANLGKGLYGNPLDFASDVRLVFENAMLYNPKTDDVHGWADQLLMVFEEMFRPIEAKLGATDRVNEFSVVDELDGSSWDDVVQSPHRSKKAKTSGPGVVGSVGSVFNKQNQFTESKPRVPIQPVVQVQSPVRARTRTPSPMQAAEPELEAEPEPEPEPEPEREPVKVTSVSTRGVVPKLPKPRAKDPIKRDMNIEEKQKLGLGLQSMPPEKMPQLLQIIRKRNDHLAQEGDEIELDIEALDTETLWELDRFVTNWKKHVSKTKRQALLVNNVASSVPGASVLADIDDVPLMEKTDVMKKSKKEAGEEDVDIGDEMPESSFPHVEIEKDDGGGGPGAVTGHGNDNASSSSSGSSSSSSGDSSSSSDSGSGSSSGSDSDADDAQS